MCVYLCVSTQTSMQIDCMTHRYTQILMQPILKKEEGCLVKSVALSSKKPGFINEKQSRNRQAQEMNSEKIQGVMVSCSKG